MNVACTACPAKYAVPDDRVRGKRVRITCKHCGTFIVVDGTHLGESGSQAGRLPQNTAANAAREKRKTMLGIGGSPNASAAASLGVPVQSSPRGSRVPPTDVPSHHAWLVALSDGRREPASLARIVDLFVSGSIDTSTYIWREGMADWKKPFEIPEIATALRARGVGPDGTKGATLPPPDPEEATRVSFSPSEELNAQAAAAPAKAANATRPPASTNSFDDESVTVALTGPPSNPLTQGRPLTPPNSGALGRRATLPPLPQAAGLPRSSSEPAMPRVRSNTIPPIGSPLPKPPTRSITPNPAPPPVVAAPTPPPPPPVIASSMPPTVAATHSPSSSFPPAAVAPYGGISSAPPAYGHVSSVPPAVVPPVRPAAYVAPAQFQVVDGVPRSGPPVSLQLDDNPFQKRGRTATVAASLILVAGLGVAGYLYFGQRAAPPPPPPPVAATPPAPPPAPTPAPAPTPSETSQPEAASAAASAVAVAEKAPSAPKASAPSRVRHDDTPRPSPRRAASSDSGSEGSSSSSGPSGTSPSSGSDSPAAEPTSAEAAMAEKLARSDDAPATPKSNSNDPEFNRDAAAQSLGEAASRADSCRTLGGPSGTGQATVTFSPNGRVSAASVGGDFAGTTVGACIARLFRGVTVPAFSGDAVTVSKRFTIE